MLTIVYGRAGAGKTAYCLKDAESRCRNGNECIIIVPEQSSFSAERSIAFDFPQELGHLVSVRTFTSLCNDIMSISGGISRERISEPARVAMVRRAVISLGQDIEYYRRHRRNYSFYVLLANAITELKNAGVSTELLRQAADRTGDATLSLKMCEIAKITDRYDSLLGNSVLDSSSAIDLASVLCSSSGFFKNKTVYLDDFSGFTVPQLNFISRMLPDCADVICTLCTDSIESDNTGHFMLSTDSARSLILRAEQAGVPFTPVLLSNKDAYHSDGAKFLEQYLAEGASGIPESGLYAGIFDSMYSEAEAVASEIAMIVRDGICAPGDITVITRNSETYLPVLESVFTKYEIPYYADSADNLSFSPVTVFFRRALDLADGLTTSGIISFIKSGLTPVTDDESALLENYAYTWDISPDMWKEPFTGNPSGYGEPGKKEQNILNEINIARDKICGFLIPFSGQTASAVTGGEIIRAIYSMFEACSAYSIIESRTPEEISEASAAMNMLNQFYNIVCDDVISPAEMAGLLDVLAYSTPLEKIPIMGGRVNICDAVRSRTDTPAAVFVMGLNEGIFPADISEPQILGYTERNLISELGISMPENFEASDAAEQYYLYKALTSSTDRIYLSCSANDPEGRKLYPCAEFVSVSEDLKPKAFASAEVPYYRIVNGDTAMSGFASAVSAEQDIIAATIESVYPEACAEAKNAAQAPHFKIEEKELAEKLTGDECTLSASRIEAYAKCPFSYFMRYMMGIKPIGRAEINPIEAGNLVHWTLEQVMRRFNGDLRNVDEGVLVDSASELSARYAEQNMGDEYNKARQSYLVNRISAQIGKLLIHIKEEQQQSRFMPADFELSIGKDADIPPLTFLTDDGHKVSIIGKIDRVDLYRSDDGLYLRVIDYKTGNKEFKLDEVYDGLSVQMLIYLFTVCENGEERYGAAPIPAGVLYMPGDPKLSEDLSEDGTEAKKSYCTDGIILKNSDVISAMEQDFQGIYIPVTSISDKESTLVSEDKFQRMRERVSRIIEETASGLYNGAIDPEPYGKEPPENGICGNCDYSSVCRYDRVSRFRPATSASGLFEEEAQ